MFLAFKEIQREKTRYGLIIAIIALITFLMFMLTALALGLRNANSAAIRSWNATSIALSEQADDQLSASMLAATSVDELLAQTDAATAVGHATVRVTSSSDAENLPFLGIDPQSFIGENIQLREGKMLQNPDEVVIDADYAAEHNLSIGDEIILGENSSYTLAGLAEDASLSVRALVYGDFSQWREVRDLPQDIAASAVLAQQELKAPAGTTVLAIDDFIRELPGYSAQNTTFSAMLGTLAIVTLVIIAVFLYILVLQQLPNIAVLRAQGIPAHFLIRTVIAQAVVMTLAGILIATVITAILAQVIPAGMPTEFSISLLSGLSCGLIVMAIVGAILPARQISRVDPIRLIG
ncbi:MAG: ABC transporter permease [Corynebacterium sp.]|nr:ABC transporter permease [Corynebacterium sp.]